MATEEAGGSLAKCQVVNPCFPGCHCKSLATEGGQRGHWNGDLLSEGKL